MIRRPPRSTRTDTLCPYTKLFRSGEEASDHRRAGVAGRLAGWTARRGQKWRRLQRFRLALPCCLRPATTDPQRASRRSEEHTSELQALMRNSYAVFCLKNRHIKHEQSNQIKATQSNTDDNYT